MSAIYLGSSDRNTRFRAHKGLPEDFWLFEDFVNENWNSGVPEYSDTKSMNGYTIYITVSYQKSDMYDETLYHAFTEDFFDWNEDMFNSVRKEILRVLRKTLRHRGCFVASNRKNLSRDLYNSLQADWHEWTESEILEQEKQGGFSPHSCYSNNRRLKTKVPGSLSPNPLTKPSSTTLLTHPNTEQTPRQITDLMKIYNDNSMKYSGELYDFLNMKIKIFYDFCEKIGLQPVNHAKAFSIMLTGKALQYYYQNIAGKDFTMQQMIDSTEKYFETPQVRQFYLKKWHMVNFESIIKKNPSRSKIDCFEIMLKKMNQIQPGLSASYRNDNVLRDHILVACQGIPECSFSLYKPSETLEGLCGDMRNAISTKANELKDHYLQSSTDDQFGTSLIYQKSKSKSAKGFENTNDQGSQSREEQLTQKKCYICGKVGCWSTKHGLEVQRGAYQRYRQLSYIKDATDPKISDFQSLLTEFEGTELNSDDEE